jgi:hypothetical protein
VGTGVIVEGSDCWGCHGSEVSAAVAPATGPTTPYLSDSNIQGIVTGTDTSITLSGSSLTNTSGTTEFKSIFTLTSKDGSVEVLTPDQINNSSATLIIPGETPAGNYKLRAAKGSGITWVISNPLNISIKNPIVIWAQSVEQSCGECSGELTVWGSGFGTAPPEGSEEFMNVMQNGVPLNITYWKDILIKATGAVCDGSEITINGLFGSATNSQIDYPGDNYCAEYGPCTEGKGNCDGDSQCASGLICARDVGANYGWPSNVDVCEQVDYPGDNYCRDNGPCTERMGDCDSDSECASGLICVHDVGADYGWPSNVDVCQLDYPGNNYCRDNGPCKEGMGDCDSDSECASGLICVNDVGADYGWPSNVDVCEK